MGGMNAFALSKGEAKSKILALIKDPEFQGIQMGIHVFSFKANEPFFSFNEDSHLKPASNVKLVTTLAALKHLGPQYTFKTKVYVDGLIKNKILFGNLYIKGFGDPKLVSEQLWILVNDLKREGFNEVQGNLVLDETFFDSIRTVRNGSSHRAYDAPLGALSVNFNTTTIYVRPANRVGLKATVIVDPSNDYVRVINKSKTGRKDSLQNIEVDRMPGKVNDTIVVTGNIPFDHPEKRFYRNITHPLPYAASFFRRFLKEQGIVIKGGNQFRSVPEGAREILVHESQPLRLIISDLNKISNNFVAEQILKTMAAEIKGVPGTTEKGLEILRDLLKELDVKNHYQLVNGSGLSPENILSAAQLVEVLKYGYKNFNVFPEYVASMGIVGIDGTVGSRLQETVAQGKVRVKTGSLTNVSALSGYLNTKGNETMAFSMIMNDFQDRTFMMQGLQDKILLMLCDLE